MIDLAREARLVPGWVHGLRQPSLAYTVRVVETDIAATAARLRLRLTAVVPRLDAPPAALDDAAEPTPPLQLLASWIHALHEAAGLRGSAMPVLRPAGAGSGAHGLLYVPTSIAWWQATSHVVAALYGLVRVCGESGAGAAPGVESVESAESGDTADAEARAVAESVRQLRAAIPGGPNVPHLLRHARRLGIPVHPIRGSVIQFGQGAASHWFDSTFTERTARIGSTLARAKHHAAAVLRQQGLPVPRHELVKDEAQAVAAAAAIGRAVGAAGAVVLKPADRDGGLGVWTGLRDEAAVRRAWRDASRHSPLVLVEAHVPGRDYRLVVLDGRLIAAVERLPASVRGDGRSTVEALVREANTDPRRGRALHLLMLDDDALDQLARQGLAPDSIPAAGRDVRLRGAANVATGGIPVAVLDRVHPDNAALAVAAADALRLDLAGIDLLLPDISRSWLETAAGECAICEVNAQPNIGTLTSDHVYGRLLEHRVPGAGRIPVLMLLGTPPAERWGARLAAALDGAGRRTGLADERTLVLAGRPLTARRMKLLHRCQALLLNRRTEALVIEPHDGAVLDDGLPIDRVDLLLIGPDHAARLDAAGRDLLGCVEGLDVIARCEVASVEQMVAAGLDLVRERG